MNSAPSASVSSPSVQLTVRPDIPAAVRWTAEISSLLQAGQLEELEKVLLETASGEVRCGELFDLATLDRNSETPQVEIHGDCRSIIGIGEHWQNGRLDVLGDVGPAAGQQMQGGELFIHGNAGPGLGRSLRGGRIHLQGNAGAGVGGPAPGQLLGMTGGEIFIRGDAGKNLAERMRRGTLFVQGNVAGDVGREMRAGTIVLNASTHGELGAGLKRGTILCLNPAAELTANLGCRWRSAIPMQPVILRVLLLYLSQAADWPEGRNLLDSSYQRYSGDLLEGGRGELFLRLKS